MNKYPHFNNITNKKKLLNHSSITKDNTKIKTKNKRYKIIKIKFLEEYSKIQKK